MMKRIVVSWLVICCFSSAFAGGKNNVHSLKDLWGGGGFTECGSHQLAGTESCIGQSQAYNCEKKRMYARDYTDEYATQMLVALKVTERGAYFCPIQIEGKNKNKGKAWTEYALVGGESGCVWLCREGYTGTQCDKSEAEVSVCDIAPLNRSDYSGLKRVAKGANIEDQVAMFEWNRWYGCGVHKGQEHDMILAVTRWTPSGHGAWVRQMIVRSEREGYDDMVSWASIYAATPSQELLVCKNGYKADPNVGECVPISTNLCAEAQSCSGWTGFDETKHKFVVPDGRDCYEYRCSDFEQGFASETERTCVECKTTMLGGVSPISGVCVRCEIGQVFDRTVDDPNNHCRAAAGYSKTDLQYGAGKTKDSWPDVSKQCWPIATPSEYKECVISGGVQKKTQSDSTGDVAPGRIPSVPDGVVPLKF